MTLTVVCVVFQKLDMFLPMMANENKKLEEAVRAGNGDQHNIEIPVPDHQLPSTLASDMEKDEMCQSIDEMEIESTAPVIEMVQ